MTLLEIRNVSRRFDDFKAVDDVSLSIRVGEFFTLLGPSGCGKTTLLRMIAGFDLPDAGHIFLEGVDLIHIPPERRPVCTVFQNYALFPHMTVGANIAFPLKMAKISSDKIKERVGEALENVRLHGFGARYPHELSGGQRQRVAVARALVSRPKLLLLDEPLSAMDAQLREQMQIELINLQKEVGITFVYVTHDQSEALALSDRIAVMNRGQVEQLDEPDQIYSMPKTRFVADFIGTCNLLDGTIVHVDNTFFLLHVPGLGHIKVAQLSHSSVAVSQTGCLALRPEKVHISAKIAHDDHIVHHERGGNHFNGVVKELLYLGDVTVYIVQTVEGVKVQALLANSAAGRTKFFEVDDTVDVAWQFNAGHFLHVLK